MWVQGQLALIEIGGDVGHQRIGVLPATRHWRAVIELIAGGADVGLVAAATSNAAEASLSVYSDDAAVRRAFYLLTQIPLAARTDDFGASLRRLGLPVNEPNLIQISASYLEAIDKAAGRHRSDLGEIAALSAVESLQAIAGRSLNTLFGSFSGSVGETQKVLADLGTVKQFGFLARDFFARLVRRHLDYYLSRELPNHVGINQRFASLREHKAFEDGLEVHCREAAHIVTRFAGEWFSKTNFEGGITEAKAGRFVHVAFKKLRKELGLRGNTGA
jgi:hypothetical protein